MAEIDPVMQDFYRKHDLPAIPADYIEAAKTTGDLNKDSIDDIVLLISQKIPKDKVDAAPQIILIFLGTKEKKFKLWKTGKKHFLRNSSSLMEPFGLSNLTIKNRVLSIGSNASYSEGTWNIYNCEQKWREENGELKLIGLTVSEFDRRCACGKTIDHNLLTQKKITKTDKGDNDEALSKEITSITKEKPLKVLWEEFNYDNYCQI